MNWKVIYSEEARHDLRAIYEYIAYELKVPDIATGQVQRIMSMIFYLKDMPMRYPLYEEEPWNKRGIRSVPVDNYIIFYLPEEESHAVNILRIMYSGRDISKQL